MTKESAGKSAHDPDGATREPVSGMSVAGVASTPFDEDFDAILREAAAVVPTAPLPRNGDVIAGKYRIEQLLGRGGMGAVFSAVHLISGKPVAIKWMLRAMGHEQARSRFLREARAAARVDHPHVVDVYDIGQDGDRGLYLVMQLLRGESLAQRLERGPLPYAEAVEWLLPAMRGVSAVHEAGVIHRDLKPDNIFLCASRKGDPPEAKVLDFGISAVHAQEGKDVTLTREGIVLGTPAYMPPEQLHDSRNVDARADVYAFGVILYEAITGKPPFTADSHNGLVLAIVTGAPMPPGNLIPALPHGLTRVIMRAMAKRRDDRYPDVASLIEALTPYASALRPAARPRWPLMVAVAALVVALALAYWTPWSAREAPVAPAAAPIASKVPVAPVSASPPPPLEARPEPPPEPEVQPPKPRKKRVLSAPAPAESLPPPANVLPVPDAPPRAPRAPRTGRISLDEL
jgi:serine/threonine protein kinase